VNRGLGNGASMTQAGTPAESGTRQLRGERPRSRSSSARGVKPQKLGINLGASAGIAAWFKLPTVPGARVIRHRSSVDCAFSRCDNLQGRERGAGGAERSSVVL